jgi:hypothetical protein
MVKDMFLCELPAMYEYMSITYTSAHERRAKQLCFSASTYTKQKLYIFLELISIPYNVSEPK